MKQLREWRSEIPFFRLGHIWDNWCGAIGTWDPIVVLPSKETSMRLDKASQHVITRWRHPRASMCTSRLVCSFIFVATIATTINAILLHPFLSELTIIDMLLPPNTLNTIHMPQISKIHTITNIIAMSPSQTKAQRDTNKIINTTWWQKDHHDNMMTTKSAKVWLISKSARQGLRLAASSRFLSSLKIYNFIFCIFIIQMFDPSFSCASVSWIHVLECVNESVIFLRFCQPMHYVFFPMSIDTSEVPKCKNSLHALFK